MKALITASLIVLSASSLSLAQPASLVSDVRARLARQDFASAEQVLRQVQTERGISPEWLEALSWMGRANLAAKQFDQAEAFAQETQKLAVAALKSRPLDQEPRLPIALGAAIEVLAQVDAARGARTDAVLALQRELASYRGTSIEKRLQKNLNLLSLEGTRAPALELADSLGKPPALEALKGKVVLMFFWAHWCPDCKNMAPILARLSESYQQQGLVVVAPSQRYGYVAGGKPATADQETAYIETVRKASYPVLAGQPVPLSTANHLRYGVSTTPTVVLVDRDGVVRLYHPGQMTFEDLEPRVKALVAAPARSSAEHAPGQH